MDQPYLKSLNAAQLKAVTHDPKIPLQILAGPGSGKTRVLTSRVAHLVRHHQIPASSICAVTFTNKAANEMRHRLKPLIGDKDTNALIMGTFHAICSRFLRKHASRIGLGNNFSICDADESKKLIGKLLKRQAATLKAKSIEMTDAFVMSCISKAKSRALSSSDVSLEAEKENDAARRITAELFEEYETTLTKNNSLDFDDLLVYGVKLFTKCPDILQSCRHILVDEFQDTSTLQYHLVKLFASSHNCISIVGDPDQSIYGWRAAEIENLDRMKKDFPATVQIFLEENYRSTASILAASHAIMAQDKTRIAKGLFTSQAAGSLPVLRPCIHEHAEADFLADEILRLRAYSGGMLNWDDFAILLRYNALSRAIESAFQKQGIPMRMLAGQRFFDRAEIKDILAYLQLVDNPNYDPAFARIVNVPPRSIGDKSIAEVEAIAKSKGWSCLETAEKLVQGKVSGKDVRLSNKLKKDLPGFVKTMRTLRDLASKGTAVADLIRNLTELIHYDEYLQRSQSDADSRWENVQELINFAEELSDGATSSEERKPDQKQQEFELNDDGTLTPVGSNQAESEEEGETPLRTFLQASCLSTDTQTEDGDNSAKVTISTCHAAKGLEWPVVFIPSVEQGSFPFYRTEDAAEERRLLYVACTRAQSFLYLTHAQSRMTGGETRQKERSEFITAVLETYKTLFSCAVLPQLTGQGLTELCQVLNRPQPTTEVVQAKIAEYRPIPRAQLMVDESASKNNGNYSGRYTGPNIEVPRFSPPPVYTGPPPTFASAISIQPGILSLVAPQFSAPTPTVLPSSTPRPQQFGTAIRPQQPPAKAKPPPSKNLLTSYFKPPSGSAPAAGPLPVPPPTAKAVLAPLASAQAKPLPVSKVIVARPLMPRENQPPAVPIPLAGGKRRLGMGRAPDGFQAQPAKRPRPSDETK